MLVQQIIHSTYAQIAGKPALRRRMAQYGTYSGAVPPRALSHAVITMLPLCCRRPARAVAPTAPSYGMLLISILESPCIACTNRSRPARGNSPAAHDHAGATHTAHGSTHTAHGSTRAAHRSTRAAHRSTQAHRSTRAARSASTAWWSSLEQGLALDASRRAEVVCAILAQQDAAVMILRETDEKNGTDDRADCVD